MARLFALLAIIVVALVLNISVLWRSSDQVGPIKVLSWDKFYMQELEDIEEKLRVLRRRLKVLKVTKTE